MIFATMETLRYFLQRIYMYNKKGKVLPYSLPSYVRPGIDPGVQAVSP